MKKLYEYGMLVLSLYVVAILAAEIVSDWSEIIITILEWIDFGMCIVFLADWFYFLGKAPDKKRYCLVHFFDLVSSIPYAQFLRPFRVVRVVRMVRALRLVQGSKGLARLLQYVFTHKLRSAMVIYLAATVLLGFYCALGLYHFEKGANQYMNSFGDALWVAAAVLTTVAYADIFPVTTGGRVFIIILSLVGLGLFSLITAELVAFFNRHIRPRGPDGPTV
jgi:voltage-gated potassium channel